MSEREVEGIYLSETIRGEMRFVCWRRHEISFNLRSKCLYLSLVFPKQSQNMDFPSAELPV
jgi:hypothetical protein